MYKGSTEPIFKSRYGNHKKAFNNIKYKKDTELSKEVWKLKERKANYNIKWSIIKQYPAYNQNTKRCMLCLMVYGSKGGVEHEIKRTYFHGIIQSRVVSKNKHKKGSWSIFSIDFSCIVTFSSETLTIYC